VIVETTLGRVRGRTREGVSQFWGIPYAAPPFGPHRFQPPQPAQPWSGVRDALAPGATVPKPGYSAPFDEIIPDIDLPGQDCLNLNVWTPDPGAGGLPVAVWVHGGAFVHGAGSVPVYAGDRFARDGVVCVTLNYRLGVDGFVHLPDAVDNRGLLDQIAALEWVGDNIAAFGGDPGAVTVFGESAGAMSAVALLSMPRAEGLFRGLIAQSGAGHHVLSPATATRVAGYLGEILGVAATAEALAAIPLDRLLAAQVELSNQAALNPDPARWAEVASNGMVYEPVVDGDVLPARPIDAIAAGTGAGVRVLAGANTEEFRLLLVPQGMIGHLDEAFLASRAPAFGLSPDAVATYRAGRPDATPGELYEAVMTDWFFRIPAIRLLEARAHHIPGYAYEFAWRTPRYDGQLAACHGLELPFVFDTLDRPGAQNLTGPDAPQAIAEAMHAAWVAFIRDGDPGWAAYEPDGEPGRVVARFGGSGQAQGGAASVDVMADPRRDERVLWEGLR
jgi:para-nitrobenzyl esterase